MAAWGPPQARDHFPAHKPEYIAEKKAQGHGMANLNDQVQLTGWSTPKSWDAAGGLDSNRTNRQNTGGPCLRDQALGLGSTSSTAPTKSIGQLNPHHSRWLMGYPVEWLSCVDWETLSSRKSLRSLSEQRGIQSVDRK
jgi:hypothetical protein